MATSSEARGMPRVPRPMMQPAEEEEEEEEEEEGGEREGKEEDATPSPTWLSEDEKEEGSPRRDELKRELLPDIELSERVELSWRGRGGGGRVEKKDEEDEEELIQKESHSSSLGVSAWVNTSTPRLGKWSMKRDSIRHIVHRLEGLVLPGELVALMGPSGSGKSTLLNILAGRRNDLPPNVEGEVLYNGKTITKRWKRKIGFVTQDDIMFDSLTVLETLTYTALLKLPTSMGSEEKHTRVRAVIEKLELRKVASTLVGSNLGSVSTLHGLSGGERKRTAIGIELLTNPAAIYLDEPTSGLDSTIALRLVELLRELAFGGRVIIASIHQPASRVYALMHRVVLLADGYLIYNGSALGAAAYFARLSHDLPFGTNIADHVVDLVNGTEHVQLQDLIEAYERTRELSKSVESLSSLRLDIDPSEHEDIENPLKRNLTAGTENLTQRRTLMRATTISSRRSSMARDWTGRLKPPPKWPANWMEQYIILTKRSFRQRRFEFFEFWTLVQYLGSAILIGLLWFQAGHSRPHTEEKIRDISGYLFFQLTFLTFSSLFGSLFTFPSEKWVIMKERNSGMYRLSAYYAAKSTTDMPLMLVYPLSLSTITYWLVGLRPTAAFVLNVVCCVGVALISQSVGLGLGAAIFHMKKAQVIGAIFTLVMVLTTGYLVGSMPIWIDWIKYISYVRYAYQILVKIEYVGANYSCESPPPGREYCSVSDISDILQTNPNTTALGQSLALGGFLILFRFLGYFALARSTRH